MNYKEKMKQLENDLQQAFKEYGFDRLDESDQITVLRMLKEMNDYKKNEECYTTIETNYRAGNYTQNYLLLKQLLNLQEQNQQIIELLTEIKNK